MKNKITLALTGVIVVAMATGCDSTKYQAAGSLKNDLQGTWLKKCINLETESKKEVYTFSNSELTTRISYYAENNCTNNTLIDNQEITYQYEIGKTTTDYSSGESSEDTNATKDFNAASTYELDLFYNASFGKFTMLKVIKGKKLYIASTDTSATVDANTTSSQNDNGLILLDGSDRNISRDNLFNIDEFFIPSE